MFSREMASSKYIFLCTYLALKASLYASVELFRLIKADCACTVRRSRPGKARSDQARTGQARPEVARPDQARPEVARATGIQQLETSSWPITSRCSNEQVMEENQTKPCLLICNYDLLLMFECLMIMFE